MIAWNDYLEKLISVPDEMDEITLSFDGGNTNISIPAIVKSSILMLDKMVQYQGKRHVLVFPEREKTALIFALIRAIHNIKTGKIEKKYSVEEFVPGDKLKIGNAVVEFLGISEMNDKRYMHIHMSDTDRYSFPVATAPIFQKTDTKRPLSGWNKFYKERKALEKNNQLISETGSYLSRLIQYKTHMSASVYYVSAVKGIKEQLADMRFCNEKLSHYILLGQTNYEGEIINLGSGQMAGIPAVVFSSDLYAVNAAIENGNPIQSLIVDISNMNLILSQLDVLDDILATGVPVIFVTDTSNSLDLQDTIEVNKGKRICLVIPERGNKDKTENFWKNELKDKNIQLEVFYPSEYYAVSNTKYDVTIIVGWLKRAIMRKLIFSYHTTSYIVLLYDYENRWKNHDVKNWKYALKNSDNKKTIENSFSSANVSVSSSRYISEDDEDISDEEIAIEDEQEEIDTILRNNKFRRYVKSGQKSCNEIVDAVPVNFVGGYIAFYQMGHAGIYRDKRL